MGRVEVAFLFPLIDSRSLAPALPLQTNRQSRCACIRGLYRYVRLGSHWLKMEVVRLFVAGMP